MLPVRSLAIACALVAVCIAYVPTRGQLGGPALYGDALLYADLVRGGVDVEAPFRYRLWVPLLARALPLAPGAALATISWFSLALSYALVLRTAQRLQIGSVAALAGLTLAVCTRTHLYNYHNPFLTDAAGLLVTTLCIDALVSRRYPLFLLSAALGMGVREACVFVAPAWLGTRQWPRTVVVLALTLAVYFALRAAVGPSKQTLDEGPFAIFPARPIPALVYDAFSAWHMLWLLAPLGLTSLRPGRRLLAWPALFLLSGALFTSLLATDTTRMFQSLFPLVALGTARFVELSWNASRRVTVFLCVACVASSWVWQPVRFLAFPPESAFYRIAYGVTLALLLLVGSWAAHGVWRKRPTSTPSQGVAEPA